MGDRPVNSSIHPAGLPMDTSEIEVLRRPPESALGAVVGMRDGLVLGWLAPPDGHLDGVDDELGTDVIGYRPAHDPATERVEDDGQVHLPVAGGVLGDIHDPQPIRFGGVEPATDEVVAGLAAVTAGAATPPSTVDAGHAGLAHEPLDALARAVVPSPRRSSACTRGDP